jgi:DsbC/DsbD-like thiol-disulfide interchange protein
MRTTCRLFLAAALIAGLTLTASHAAAAPTSADKVKITAKATAPDADGNQVLTLELNIEKPFHLTANPAGNDTYEENQVVVKVEAREKPASVKVEYPEGEVYKDKATGDSFKIYHDKATIKAKVQRAKGDTSPLQVSIFLAACDDKACLPTSTVKINVP